MQMILGMIPTLKKFIVYWRKMQTIIILRVDPSEEALLLFHKITKDVLDLLELTGVVTNNQRKIPAN